MINHRQNIWSILLLSTLTCFLLLTAYSVRIFVNITPFNIIIYHLLFLSVMLPMAFFILKPDSIVDKNMINTKNTFYGIGVIIFVLLLSFSMPEYWTSQHYIKTLPLFSIDHDLGWHKDTAFNVSLIKSILNWGYPSVALDGHPLSAYHVLSHYIDAVLLKISHIDALDGYGFISLTKCCFFIISCLIFTAKFSQTRGQFFFSSLLFIPAFIGTWHAIGSHALWSVSFILLFSSAILIPKILQEKPLNKFDYTLICIAAILLCFGKISTGFSFICIYFSALFFKEYKNKSFYISALLLIIFIAFYQKFINYSYGIDNHIVLSRISVKNFFNYVFSDNLYASSVHLFAYLFIFLYFIKNKSCVYFRLLFSTICSSLLLFVITTIFSGFNSSDIYYFFIGYYSTLLPIAFVCIINYYNEVVENHNHKQLLPSIFFLGAAIILTHFVYTPSISVSHVTAKKLVLVYRNATAGVLNQFDEISGKSHSLYNPISKEEYVKLTENGVYTKLKHELASISENHEIPKSKMALFIPSDIVKEQILPRIPTNHHNFYAMNIYAVTGVQLIKSIYQKQRAYGFANYDEKSILAQEIEINIPEICRNNALKMLVIVKDFNQTKLNTIPC